MEKREARSKWLRMFPSSMTASQTKVGGFADTSPFMVMSRDSVRNVAEAAGDENLDERRFRANVVVKTDTGVPFQVIFLQFLLFMFFFSLSFSLFLLTYSFYRRTNGLA